MKIKFPRITLLFIGITITLILVASLEFGLRAFAPEEVNGLRMEQVSSRPGRAKPEGQDWMNWAQSGYTVRMWYREKLLATSDVNFDNFGRRVVPQSDLSRRKKHFIFLGGSLAFGEGVNDDETMPAAYAKIDQRSQVYNYGIPGAGPNQFAAQLENQRFFSAAAVPQRSGTLVYVYYASYLGRIQNSVGLFMYWKDRPMPSYRLNENGKAEFEGDFRAAHPWRTRIYSLIANSAIFRYLRLDYPPSSNRHSYTMATAMIELTKEQYLRQFPDGRFVVLIYPEKSPGATTSLVPKLRERGIEVIDYSINRRFSGNRPKHWIEHHYHPNKQMNYELAEMLYNDIQRVTPMGSMN